MHKIACPLSAKSRKNETMDQALCESNPDVGSSRNKSNRGYDTCIKLVRLNGKKGSIPSQPIPPQSLTVFGVRFPMNIPWRLQILLDHTFLGIFAHLEDAPSFGQVNKRITYYSVFSDMGTERG